MVRDPHLIPGIPVHANLVLPLWLSQPRSREGKMNFGVLWVSLSSSVCQIKNEREGGQRIFQMESSEEGTTRLPLHSDVAGLSEHRATSQEEHRLLPDPVVEWGGGRRRGAGGPVTVGLEWEHIPTRHTQAMWWRQSIYPKSWVGLVRGWALHPGLFLSVFPQAYGHCRNQNGELVFSNLCVSSFRMNQPCKKGDLR